MNEIKCPNCNQVFKVDETTYSAILQQVKTKEFYEELKDKEQSFKVQQDLAVEKAKSTAKDEYEDILKNKDKQLFEREREILLLKEKLTSAEQAKELAVTKAVSSETQKLTQKETEILKLESQLSLEKERSSLREKDIKEDYERKLKDKDTQIDYYKDLKSKLNVTGIANVHFFEFSENFYTKNDRHPFYELVFVSNGSLDIKSESYSGELTKNSLIIHQPNEFHWLR